MSERKVAGVSPLDPSHRKEDPPVLGGIQLQESVVVQRSPSVCYSYWRNFKNLPNFMAHIHHIDVINDQRSHWIVAGPADTFIEWDAEIIADKPNERISWRSVPPAQMENAGSVSFASQQGDQTEVKVVMSYNPTLGAVGDWVTKLLGEAPADQLKDDLVRFKETLEKNA